MDQGLRQLHAQAQRQLNARSWRALEASCRQLLGAAPGFADAHFLGSIAAEALGQRRRAMELARAATRLAPGQPDYQAQLARCLSRSPEIAATLAAARAAVRAAAPSASALDTAGVVLSRLGRYQEARDALARAVALDPGRPQFHFNLATAERFLGRDDRAQHHYRRALSLRPGFARAWWALSELGGDVLRAGDRARIEALHGRAAPGSADALYLAHARARLHEQCGDTARAFEALTRAKTERRAVLAPDRTRDARRFALLRAVEEGHFGRGEAGSSPSPLFIVGMPRTGTTLVEQILSSHTEVATLGELQDLPHALKRASGSRSGALLDESVIAGARGRAASIGNHYRGLLRARLAGGETAGLRYVIDKMPMNALYVGVLREAMPDARIVLLRRHPLDTCLSNYRQLFALDATHYHYAYDLMDTARFLTQFRDLMAHWQARFGNAVYELDYEALVDDPLAAVSGLLNYLGLPWQDACLSFHTRGGAVATPSAAQVRRPLYRDAVGRWTRWERELAPVRSLFEAEGLL